MTHIAAVNTHAANTAQRRGAHGSYVKQTITNVERLILSLVKGWTGAAGFVILSRRCSDCNNVKSKEKLTLYKENKKSLDKLQAVLHSHTLHSAHLAVNAMVKVWVIFSVTAVKGFSVSSAQTSYRRRWAAAQLFKPRQGGFLYFLVISRSECMCEWGCLCYSYILNAFLSS